MIILIFIYGTQGLDRHAVSLFFATFENGERQKEV
jgi:hypothetical protein